MQRLKTLLLFVYRGLLVLVFLWLVGNTIVSAQQQYVRQQDFDKLEKRLNDITDQLGNHVTSDYKSFNALTTADANKIADLNTRLAVMEATMGNMTRILWGVAGAVCLQLLHLFFQVFRVDVVKREIRQK